MVGAAIRLLRVVPGRRKRLEALAAVERRLGGPGAAELLEHTAPALLLLWPAHLEVVEHDVAIERYAAGGRAAHGGVHAAPGPLGLVPSVSTIAAVKAAEQRLRGNVAPAAIGGAAVPPLVQIPAASLAAEEALHAVEGLPLQQRPAHRLLRHAQHHGKHRDVEDAEQQQARDGDDVVPAEVVAAAAVEQCVHVAKSAGGRRLGDVGRPGTCFRGVAPGVALAPGARLPRRRTRPLPAVGSSSSGVVMVVMVPWRRWGIVPAITRHGRRWRRPLPRAPPQGAAAGFPRGGAIISSQPVPFVIL